MKPWPLALRLALSLCCLLHSGLGAAWTEEDLRAAERLLDRKIEARRAAEAKAKAEAEAKLQRQQAIGAIPEGMVKIPGGTFRMGCSPGDSQCSNDEKPPHKVGIHPFRMGKTEVTQAQWQAVMDDDRSPFKGDDRPVESVSWNDVQTFFQRLNAQGSGKPYRLPSEAEWEYAARGGTKTAYWWGQAIGTGHANCDGCGSQWDNKETAPVGSFKPNAFGLYDTTGNVWEWVQDCDHDSYTGAPADGSEWSGSCQSARRVLRGGSCYYIAKHLRVSNRDKDHPDSDSRSDNHGLRLAQDL